jgi:hypothetical protein
MQYVKVENGVVVNAIVCDNESFAASIGYVQAQNGAGIGWSFDGVNFAPPAAPEPKAPTVADFEVAVQGWLDQTAKAWQYESILSAASYAASTVPKFKAEAAALIAWRDAVWSACYATMDAVQAGTQAAPATTAALLASLPTAPGRPLA